jgi:signal transduction histidine kinase
LAVDDEPVVLEMLERVVEKSGLGQFHGMVDPIRAVEEVRSWAPDLVLVDLRMPGMSGIELIRRLRAEHGVATPPILVLTAVTDRDTRIAALRNGAMDYIVKPVDREELVVRATGLLERRALQRSLLASNEHLETAVIDRTRQLAEALDAAQSAQRMQSHCFNLMSHEFRASLNAIVGFSELLLSPSGRLMPAQETEYLGFMQKSGRHLLRLIDRVLLYAQVGSAEMPGDELVTISSIVTRVTRATAADMRAKSMDLTVANMSSGCVVKFDARLLERALVEILDNAIKFAPKRTRITISVRDCPQSGDLLLAVTDEGPGIQGSPRGAGLQLVAAPDLWISDAEPNIELGLAMARRIIEMHQGRLDITDDGGNGATVTLVVPASRRVPPPSGEQLAPTVATVGAL